MTRHPARVGTLLLPPLLPPLPAAAVVVVVVVVVPYLSLCLQLYCVWQGGWRLRRGHSAGRADLVQLRTLEHTDPHAVQSVAQLQRQRAAAASRRLRSREQGERELAL